jgi:hypothetical protein
MEISELILSHHFFRSRCAPTKKKKLNRRRLKRLKHWTMMVVVTVKQFLVILLTHG